MVSVSVGFVGTLWVVRGEVVREDFGARIGWERGRGVGRESSD
jgi:hypothetical protein